MNLFEMNLLDHVFYGNSVKNWMWALIALLTVLTVLRLLRGFIAARLAQLAARTATRLDDRLSELVNRTRFFFILVLAFYAGSLFVTLPTVPRNFIDGLLVVALAVQVGLWLTAILRHVVAHYVETELGEGSEAIAASTALDFIGKLVVWTALLLLALDNLGWEIGPLIAGLGVTGIAVALAAQNILGDLFASFSIIFDKPFVIGDFIVVDNFLGTVERIGLKTTRLKSVNGEQLILSNADLLKSRIRNFKVMQERRIVFSVGVTYQTPYHQLVAIPGMIREIINSQLNTRFDRAHFAQYGDSSLNFEAVYWVRSPDYAVYMDTQQNINLAIFKQFEENGIEFAYPTRTLYVETPAPRDASETSKPVVNRQ
jgi:small-conductance mechanosensitive channel